MTERKFTPGPWRWDGPLRFGEHGMLLGMCDKPGWHPVVEVQEGAVYSEYSSDPACVQVAEADARLIAAAPDLIDALEECAEYFDDRADVNWEGDGPNKEMQMFMAVKAALEKAGVR